MSVLLSFCRVASAVSGWALAAACLCAGSVFASEGVANGSTSPPFAVGLPAKAEILLGSPDLAGFALLSERGDAGVVDRGLAADADAGRPSGARSIRAIVGSGQAWNVELKHALSAPIAAGDVLFLRYRLRAAEARAETGEGMITVYLQRGRPEWDKLHYSIDDAGPVWRTQAHAFVADRAIAAGEAELGFGFDVLPQTIELADVELMRFPAGTPLASLPADRPTYAGRAADASWRAAADERIESLRKGDLLIEVVDDAGRPVPGARIGVEQLRHAFVFGTAVVPHRLLDEDPDSVAYRERFLSLFNGVVPESELKWVALEGEFGPVAGDFAKTKAALTWARARGAEVRGHVLVWPGWQNLPRRLRALETDPPALRRAVLDHIASLGERAAGLADEWDVLNEPFSNHDLMDVLGEKEQAEWFKAAAVAFPGLRLFLNDYGILSGGGLNRVKQDAFLSTARYLLDQGAPLGGLGLQGHFGASVTPPERLIEVLDRFAELGLPLRVTEFDLDMSDEELQADYTRDFYTALFSHPAVDAVYTWGFWSRQHWAPRAAYFGDDWTERPNGRALRELIRGRWWTRLDTEAGADGRLAARVFAGRHAVTVEKGGRRLRTEIEVAPRGSVPLRVVLQSVE